MNRKNILTYAMMQNPWEAVGRGYSRQTIRTGRKSEPITVRGTLKLSALRRNVRLFDNIDFHIRGIDQRYCLALGA